VIIEDSYFQNISTCGSIITNIGPYNFSSITTPISEVDYLTRSISYDYYKEVLAFTGYGSCNVSNNECMSIQIQSNTFTNLNNLRTLETSLYLGLSNTNAAFIGYVISAMNF
jgi:hypothetical protein